MSNLNSDLILSSGLYVVATPIGNLDDLSSRAKVVLASVSLILAEDTRITSKLLKAYGITNKLISFHGHNEFSKINEFIELIKKGGCVAIVSDAGTPGVSDPGRMLVSRALKEKLDVFPIPGASALTSAISVSGFSSSPMHFFGFLPNKGNIRSKKLNEILSNDGTIVVFEAPHRIIDLAERLAEKVETRQIVICRELTKKFAEVASMKAFELKDWLKFRPTRIKGEFVVILGPLEYLERGFDTDVMNMLERLIRELPPSKVASVVSDLTGIQRELLYKFLIDRFKS